MARIKEFYQKECFVLLASVMLGIVFTVCFACFTKRYSETVQAGIAGEVVRFHVLPNSNTAEDQALKQKVRDGVLDRFRYGLEAAEGIAETKAFLAAHMTEIKECAGEIIAENGYAYPVRVSMSRDFFPTKTYGDVTLPPGEYEALRVVIGDGDGQNWWCVMFPPLCYVDAAKNQIPKKYKQELKNVLTEEEYQLVSRQTSDSGVKIKIKFKIVEWWMNRKT